MKSLGVPLDKSGRVIVNPDLTIPGHPEIFVIGDAACNYDKDKKRLPGIAPVAIQHGCYVAKLIHQQEPAQERKPFVYFDKGMIATIGRAKAVAIIGRLKISGYLAWLAWGLIHVVYLISFASRLLIMTQWIFLYFFNERRIRLVTRPVIEKEDLPHL